MTGHGIHLNTLKECLQFLHWLNKGGGSQKLQEASLNLENRIKQYYTPNFLKKGDVEYALSEFVRKASGIYERLSKDPQPGKYGGVDAQKITDALLECHPKFFAAMYYLQYCVNNSFKKLGGGGWEKDYTGWEEDWPWWGKTGWGGDLQKYLRATVSDPKYSQIPGLLPGGFGRDEGSNMYVDLEKILEKRPYNFFRSVFVSSVIGNAASRKENSANALSLVRTFCDIVKEADPDTGGSLITALNADLKGQVYSSDKTICWQELRDHCAKLRKKFDTFFNDPKRFDFTGQSIGLDKLQTKELATRAANWMRGNLTKVRGKLKDIEEYKGQHPGAYFTKNLFPYGFTFNGQYRSIRSDKELQALVGDLYSAARELQTDGDGLDRLSTILHGVRQIACTKPEPPPPKAEGNQNQGKKAEGAQNQGKKAEGPPHQNNGQSGDTSSGPKVVQPPASDTSPGDTGGQGPQGPPGSRSSTSSHVPDSSVNSVATSTPTGSLGPVGSKGDPGAPGSSQSTITPVITSVSTPSQGPVVSQQPPPPPSPPSAPAAAPGPAGQPSVQGAGPTPSNASAPQPILPPVTVVTQSPSVSSSSAGPTGDQGAGKNAGQGVTQTTSSITTTSGTPQPGGGGSGGGAPGGGGGPPAVQQDECPGGKMMSLWPNSETKFCVRDYDYKSQKPIDKRWEKYDARQRKKHGDMDALIKRGQTLLDQKKEKERKRQQQKNQLKQQREAEERRRQDAEIERRKLDVIRLQYPLMAAPEYHDNFGGNSPKKRTHKKAAVPIAHDLKVPMLEGSGIPLPPLGGGVLDGLVGEVLPDNSIKVEDHKIIEIHDAKRRIHSGNAQRQRELQDLKLKSKHVDEERKRDIEAAQKEAKKIEIRKTLQNPPRLTVIHDHPTRFTPIGLPMAYPIKPPKLPNTFPPPYSQPMMDITGKRIGGPHDERDEKFRRFQRENAYNDFRDHYDRRTKSLAKEAEQLQNEAAAKDKEAAEAGRQQKLLEEMTEELIVPKPKSDGYNHDFIVSNALGANYTVPPIIDKDPLKKFTQGGYDNSPPTAIPPEEYSKVRMALEAENKHTVYGDVHISVQKPSFTESHDDSDQFDLHIDVRKPIVQDPVDNTYDDPYANDDDVLRDEFKNAESWHGEDKGFSVLPKSNFNLEFTPSFLQSDGDHDPGIPRDTPRKPYDQIIPVFPDSGVCQNPWYVPDASSTTVTPPLSPPPDTDHLPPPDTVREMLCWLVGMAELGYVEKIKEHVKSILKEYNKDASQPPDALEVTRDPYNLDASIVSNTLTQACLYAASVLHRIKHKDISTAVSTLDFTSEYSKLYYSTDPAALLCQLRDYAYVCYHQLEFLKSQCNRGARHGGWQDYEYGSGLSSPKSPLQAFLTDASDSKFETHPFDPYDICRKSRVNMGFTKDDLPTPHETGNHLHTILSPSCGDEDPLLTLSSYLTCLTRRTPRTTGELVSFFHNFGNSLHEASSQLSPLGSALSNRHDDCPKWDCLGEADLNAIKDVLGSGPPNSNHNNGHLKTLSTFLGCGIYNVDCPQLIKPITYRAYALYSSSFAHHYLSWAAYLPDRLWESLLRLQDDLEKLQCAELKSLHACPKALPLLYTHGFTPPDGTLQSSLTCSKVIVKLEEVVAGEPIAELMTAMDTFLYRVREPFLCAIIAL
ncbi:ribosome binding protein [Babesia ovata]|uniref:Ribosome binding protein n=1 Tax=Babesia ovata TaxID=189622 RepID=A0A2H6KI27_9APIC|nr:ribosome binding protein [Babesia ovata]GBE62629.1 ribosome binding protein [Babesia ovata]